MAAPTKAAYVKKALANQEPSTHGTKPTSLPSLNMSALGGEADMAIPSNVVTVWSCQTIFESKSLC